MSSEQWIGIAPKRQSTIARAVHFCGLMGNYCLPNKILRLAFHDLTGRMPASEQLTGGRASVRVLTNLGFDAIDEKPPPRSNRNPEKNARRAAFRRALVTRFGEANVEEKVPALCVPDLAERKSIDSDLMGTLVAVESVRGLSIQGRKNHVLRCDFYLPAHRMIIEFDERQHFTLPRAASLRAYPTTVPLGFDKERWIALCEEIQAADNDPFYRDEQRAFYDSIRDIVAPKMGFKPVVRIFEQDIYGRKR
jgi:hypothetical protein